ncbi:MAG: ATP-binding protein [Pseudanabaenaceae cyanobacterium SKYGB_i_bin29]|nr:cell wall metabolism sensor histidine kinase WalK [Pseudanabaenaceae cyanobacterium SKYG29]MDW8421128.1 ATP-binding protein [Pseudanabaenaceae cyanobacterium SKYGB_i_bin29]
MRSFLLSLRRWWAGFTLQTKLMAVLTIGVSLLMSAITFWAVNDIQTDARLNDTRFGKDLGLLLAANVSHLVATDNRGELARVTKNFFESSSSIRYIFYANPKGEVYFGIPFDAVDQETGLTLPRRLQLPENLLESDQPFVRQHETPQGQVTDVFVPLRDQDQAVGILAMGINPNPAVVVSSSLTMDVTTAVFVSIWAMVILGAASNAVTITRPIRELAAGVQNIAAGNFQQRIDLPFGGELGELIRSFNEMAERLARYEEQNIEELAAEKAKLETLVATIADGAILLDLELKVVLVNPAALNILGWQGAIGQNILNLLHPAVEEEIGRPLMEIAAGERAGGEFRVTINGEGETNRSLRFWLNRVLSTSNTLKGIAITVQDITREVELNAAQSRFISNVSHELRTPLFNIKSFIETLYEYDDQLTPEQKHEFLETANRETDRLARLVNDVLDLSRLESGRRYRFDPTDINLVIEQTLRTYQLNARDKGITLIKETSPNLPKVWGNYDMLLQVMANLVGNALKFTPAGGKVYIRAYSWEEQNMNDPQRSVQRVRVEVEDTGIGIEPEHQKRIFDRFFRVENRVHTLEGTGLGLSIVRNIIEKHHSSVHLKSEVGVGTTFWFDLSVYQDKCDLSLPEVVEVDHQQA